MERAIDVVIDIHTKAEIGRLMEDINQKCKQIGDLLRRSDDEFIKWSNPKFYVVHEKKRIALKL